MSARPELASLESLAEFKAKRVLASSEKSKYVALEGELAGERAVVRVTKKHLPCSELAELSKWASGEMKLGCTLQNDVYAKYDGVCRGEDDAGAIGGVNVDVICPASDKHVAKYTAAEMVMISETGEAARLVTEAYVASVGEDALAWVYNILEGKAEADRVIFADDDVDTGFVLLPDLKWDGANAEQLYVVVLPHRRGIRTLRSLRAEHLPLLRNIAGPGKAAVAAHYGVPVSELQAFVHYVPSYFHFHVHITHVKCDIADASLGRAHLLDDVIGNLAAFGDEYYQQATLGLLLQRGSVLEAAHAAYNARPHDVPR
ncbi:mRNA decapping enzyme [Thecamonas trahens ATCC 50062]|uniref:m7GpppX diphosphatase n=1 Tax=Thecamonas trahens ATCC 50062 TaxID=461836 RepID=A0A0L0D5S6_THETB|nr:mRNA decapping enzyme [Thecamonas trahens ATCC 50062]KNC47441.1 mRNA decapping enzyme [Thecamonas trahens ATCC 50062]|eukprot:XP_013759378.1 mRNA decapping enzyme [Thecamonas trahens ATCC 50062]